MGERGTFLKRKKKNKVEGLPGTAGRGSWLLLNMDRESVYKMRTSELDGGNACTAMEIYLNATVHIK